MNKFGLLKPKSLLIRSCRRTKRGATEHCVSNLSAVEQNEELISCATKEEHKSSTGDVSLSSWVPHPRSGIYYPKGKEWVMDDVPVGAASFDHTYWLRSIEGVEEPFPHEQEPHIE